MSAEHTSVQLGPVLFKFESHSAWVNRAQRAWKQAGLRSDDTICLDAKGRPCRIGLHMATARDEGAFPVTVYLLRDDMPQYRAIPATASQERS